MTRECEWKDCKFCDDGICVQKDGGGVAYGMDSIGRLKHKEQSEEIKQNCRCCIPDLGQYKKKLLEIGNDVASIWGGSCYDVQIEVEEEKVIFACIEHSEEFVTEMTFEELKEEYKLDLNII